MSVSEHQSVTFEDLALEDQAVNQDRNHNANGVSGTVYWLDAETKMV